MGEDLTPNLEGVAKEQYGSDYTAHLLEQYKLYVEMADKISGRRQAANTFFLTINTAIIALLGAVVPSVERFSTVWYAVVSAAGIILCFSWFRLLSSYRDLNSAKFKVIHEIERKLPIRPYDAEWTSVGRGKSPKLYLPFSHIETKVPWVFAGLYIALIVIAVIHGK